jgi:hypothetical protein
MPRELAKAGQSLLWPDPYLSEPKAQTRAEVSTVRPSCCDPETSTVPSSLLAGLKSDRDLYAKCHK